MGASLGPFKFTNEQVAPVRRAQRRSSTNRQARKPVGAKGALGPRPARKKIARVKREDAEKFIHNFHDPQIAPEPRLRSIPGPTHRFTPRQRYHVIRVQTDVLGLEPKDIDMPEFRNAVAVAGRSNHKRTRAAARQLKHAIEEHDRARATPTKQQLARKHPTQPGVRPYLGYGTDQERRTKRLIRLGTGQRKLTTADDRALQAAQGRRPALTKSAGADNRRLLDLARADASDEHGSFPLGLVGIDKAANAAIGASNAVARNVGPVLAKQISPLTTVAEIAGIPGAAKADDLLGNAVTDALSLAGNVIPSVYLTGRAVQKAAGGDSRDIKALAKGFVEHDPLALAAQGRFKKAGKEAFERPVSTVLEFYGGAGAVGRAAGVVARRSPGRVGRFANAKRKPLRIHGHLEERRSYSPDMLRRGVQMLVDRHREKTQPLGRHPDKARKAAAKLADEEVATIEGLRREHRDEIIARFTPRATVRKFRQKINNQLGEAERGVFGLAVDRTIRSPQTARADLARYRQKLEGAHARMLNEDNPNAVHIEANRKLAAAVDSALAGGFDAKKLFEAADDYVRDYRIIEKELENQGILEPTRSRTAKLVPYAVTYMDAKHVDARARAGALAAANRKLNDARRQYAVNPTKDTRIAVRQGQAAVNEADNMPTGLVGPDGRKLTADEIERHMAENGAGPPGFFAQKAETTMKGAAYVNKFPHRHAERSNTRTGSATAKGTFDASHDAVYRHLIRATGVRDWARGFDRLVNRFGARHPQGGIVRFKNMNAARTYMETQEWRKWADENGFPEMTPVRVAPVGSKNADVEKAHRAIEDGGLDANVHADESTELRAMLVAAENDGPGPVVLVPKPVWDRLRDHYRPSNRVERGLQGANRLMKSAILPVSSKWFAGNTIDNEVRMLVNGVGPRDWALGRRLLNELDRMDSSAGEVTRVKLTGGAHFGSFRRMQVFRSAEDYDSAVVRAMARFRKAPVARHAADAYALYRDGVFALNGRLEKQFQTAAFGRTARRQIREARGSWFAGLRVHPRAIEEFANGLRETDSQIEVARSLRKITGNWDTYGPDVRRLLFDHMTFGAWTANALRLVYRTLPADHPILTGILAGIETMTTDERRRLGLDRHAAKPRPEWQQGSIPTKSGLIPFQGLTSFGFATAPHINAAGMFFAPFSGSYKALTGVDWKGDKLRNADGSPLTKEQRALVAALAVAETVVPLMALGRRIREQGGKSLPGSTVLAPRVKRGTKKSSSATAMKILNPFAPIASTGTASTASTVPAGGVYDLEGWRASRTAAPEYDLEGWRKARGQ